MNTETYFTYQWRYKQNDFKFCPRCGSHFNLEDIHIKDQPQLICHNCKFIFYLDPKLVVAALVTFENKVLLLQRAEEPGVGKWAFPGGHVSRGVDLFEAITSEIKEEAGLEDVEIGNIITTYSFKEAGLIQLVYLAKSKSEKIEVNIESISGFFFSEEDIPWENLAFETTRDTLIKFFGNK